MIALTNKLNERDEAIVQLQLLENKNNRVIALENILRRNNIRIPDDNINQFEKEKYHSTGKVHKLYLPYEAEVNEKEFQNTPLTLLSPDEKIRELKNIVKEQEKEINILKIVSQKFINTSQQNNSIDVKGVLSKVEKDYEMKVRNLFHIYSKLN
jgi:hypothetical protein